MQYKMLGDSRIKVSKLCLGTMTWGSQNSQEDANEQIEVSLDNGINFLDTAEMYPTTPRSLKTQGDTERIIGNWIKENNKRAEIVLATKITGKGFNSIRNGESISIKNLRPALEGSLKRLQTDYIDLYQLHWANRGSYHFRQNWSFDPSKQNTQKELEDIFLILEELNKFIKEGKIRTIGLSNETSWGTMQFLKIAKQNNLPKIVSIQNEYSMLCRHFDLDMAEVCHHENIGLLSFSPLACGILSGKYLDNKVPKGSRKSVYEDLGNRNTKLMVQASKKYVGIAQKYNVDPCQMALSFCLSRPFMVSVIFGATNKKQLLNNIQSANLTLEQSLLDEILKVYKLYPIPF
jgi:aryl-alcohol dehydrogenase-like predicted oxidoreductase